MDSLSLLMNILGIIVDCAKAVAVIIAIFTGMAFLKYFSLKWRGLLLPSIAVTTFVITIVGLDLQNLFGVIPLMWMRLVYFISTAYGGVTYLVFLFTIVLCVAIATKLSVASYNSVGVFKCYRDTRRTGIFDGSLSNSYLAITPVLLS